MVEVLYAYKSTKRLQHLIYLSGAFIYIKLAKQRAYAVHSLFLSLSLSGVYICHCESSIDGALICTHTNSQSLFACNISPAPIVYIYCV